MHHHARTVVLGLAALLAAGGMAAETEKVSGIPAAATLSHGSDLDRRKLEDYAGAAVAKHEKFVLAQFEIEKRKIEAELTQSEKERIEREKRRNRYKEQKGDTQTQKDEEQAKVVRVRVDFIVPEYTATRQAIAACQTRAALAQSVVDTLPKLDDSNDGSLTDEEYRYAAAMVRSTERVLKGIDPDKDGTISALELEGSRTLPANAAVGVRAALSMVDQKEYRIPKFDANADGVLDVGEQKAIAVAYAQAILNYKSEAATQERIAAELEHRQKLASARFENLEVRAATALAEKPKP